MVRRKYDIAVIIGIVLVLLSFASFRSEFRLRSEMPTEFFDATRIPREKRSSEEKIAQAYWDCAVKEVQWNMDTLTGFPTIRPRNSCCRPQMLGR